ncbi:unnamed protein product [Linum tenue]|uniref:Uncharacterized protein n=1 Tax=Linum tenue TaxID=586396 RepID=A0AAV0J594_9ROSI|nr:unnamed protein product [Linum tenue]
MYLRISFNDLCICLLFPIERSIKPINRKL